MHAMAKAEAASRFSFQVMQLVLIGYANPANVTMIG